MKLPREVKKIVVRLFISDIKNHQLQIRPVYRVISFGNNDQLVELCEHGQASVPSTLKTTPINYNMGRLSR
jgi:hypothetical protein